MAIKQVFNITDKILNETFEVFGQSGCLISEENNIMLLDFAQMGQYIIENCAKETNDDMYTVSEKDISAMCRQWSMQIADIILDTVVENAISDVNDDEELELIK